MELIMLIFAEMTPQEVIQHLVKAREEKGYSQEDIAKQLGISQVQYSKYERRVSDMALSKFLELLRILEVDISTFSDNVQNSKEEMMNFIEKQERSLKNLKEKLQ